MRSVGPTGGGTSLPDPVTAEHGGTGIATYAVGDLLYASGATTLAKLADVAVGQVLISGGVGVAPAWSAAPVVTSLSAPAATALTFNSNAANGGHPFDFNSVTPQTGLNDLFRFRNNGVTRYELDMADTAIRMAFMNTSGSQYAGIEVYASGLMGPTGSVNFAPISDNVCALGDSNRGWSTLVAFRISTRRVTLATSGAVTYSPASGNCATLTGVNGSNITGITITAPTTGIEGELITMELVQSPDGLSTWAFTTFTNCELVGGAFTKSAGASARDTITFRGNVARGKWVEASRSMAVS